MALRPRSRPSSISSGTARRRSPDAAPVSLAEKSVITSMAGFECPESVITSLAGFELARSRWSPHGRFCRPCRPQPPGGRKRDPGGLKIGPGRFSTHTGRLLDAPQRPAEPPQCDDLFCFSLLKTLLMTDEANCPSWQHNVLKPSLYGRFSGDHLWPVLGDHRGRLRSTIPMP